MADGAQTSPGKGIADRDIFGNTAEIDTDVLLDGDYTGTITDLDRTDKDIFGHSIDQLDTGVSGRADATGDGGLGLTVGRG